MSSLTKQNYTPTVDLTETIRMVMAKEHLGFSAALLADVRAEDLDDFGAPIAVLLKELRARDAEIERLEPKRAQIEETEQSMRHQRYLVDLLMEGLDQIEAMITSGKFCSGGDVLNVIEKTKARSVREVGTESGRAEVRKSLEGHSGK